MWFVCLFHSQHPPVAPHCSHQRSLENQCGYGFLNIGRQVVGDCFGRRAIFHDVEYVARSAEEMCVESVLVEKCAGEELKNHVEGLLMIAVEYLLMQAESLMR